MKKFLLGILAVAQLHGAPAIDEKPMSCHEIIKQIDLLEKKKNELVTANLAYVLFGGGVVYGQEYKKLDAEIRVLKLKLSDCK